MSPFVWISQLYQIWGEVARLELVTRNKDLSQPQQKTCFQWNEETYSSSHALAVTRARDVEDLSVLFRLHVVFKLWILLFVLHDDKQGRQRKEKCKEHKRCIGETVFPRWWRMVNKSSMARSWTCCFVWSLSRCCFLGRLFGHTFPFAWIGMHSA